MQKKIGPHRLALQHHRSGSPVHLGFFFEVRFQWQERLTQRDSQPLFGLAHVFSYVRGAAGITVLGYQALENALGGVWRCLGG